MKIVILTLISIVLSFSTAYLNPNKTCDFVNEQSDESIVKYNDDDINNPNDSDPNVIYETDFDNEMTGGIPKGWITYNEAGYHLYGFNHDGSQYNYNWGGNPGGGGSRLYEGFSGDFNKAMYWGSRGTNKGYATYGEQVKDYMLEGGVIDPDMPEGIALQLEARKYQISFLMAALKYEPTFTFTLEDLNGNVHARYTDLVAAPNVNGAIGKVTGSVSFVKNLTISDPGYYVLRFTAAEAQWQEYLLANVKIITRCDCQVNGIYYNLDETSKTACVTSNMRKQYYGSITIPSTIFYKGTKYTVNGIEGYAFSNCSDLTSITIPNSITTIGNSAFSGCNGLLSIEIPNSVTTIGDDAFNGCSGLTSITIGKSVTNIGIEAFRGCYGLTSLFIVDGTESVSFSTNSLISKPFVDCPIESLYLGRNISYSDLNSPFSGITTLTSLTIGNSVSSIGSNAFSGCTGLTSINIPNRVTSIGDYAFRDCSGLTSIEIPNRVTFIGDYAFSNCNDLISLSIPISVTSIGYSAFYGCKKLESVYSEITNVFNIDAFGKGSENATLYVPDGTKLFYIQTDGWNVFKDIIEMDPAIMNTSLLLSCNSKGSITINGTTVFTNKIGSVDILEDAENTLVFTPKANCKLEQINFNGLDITTSIDNNTLKVVIPAKTQMVVTFANEAGDVNGDSNIDISDVVSLVNMILGQ